MESEENKVNNVNFKKKSVFSITMNQKIFLTGLPHCGKSTLLEAIISQIPKKQGFLTREIKEAGSRTGFRIVTASGDNGTLASIHSTSPIRVSKYGVNIPSFEAMLPPLLSFQRGDLLYIDEVGQMELYSDQFQDLVRNYLSTANSFIGTLSAVYDHPLIKEIKQRDDVRIIEVRAENRDALRDEIYPSLR